MAKIVAPPPASFTLAVRTYLSMAYAKFHLVIIMLLFTGFSLPIVAQSPIECDGELNCPAPEPWRTKNANFTLNGNCTISVTFRYTRCCEGCNYIIEILNMNAVNLYGEPCGETASSIVYYSIKLALVELYRAESSNMNPAVNEVVVKTNSCYQYIPLPWGETQLNQCGTLCCVTKYTINQINNVLSVTGELSLANGNQTQGCNVEVEGCQVACIGHQLTPTNINMEDYPVTDLCNLDCYWKLDGNSNVTNSNFIGPTNGQDFVVKTKNTDAVVPEVMERIRVHNNSKIDFKLNSWNSMPQITFDSPTYGVNYYGDPFIKFYRPTGDFSLNGRFPSFPWWIGINMESGLPADAQASFNIFSGSSSLPGDENSTMNRLFTILRNGNVGINEYNPSAGLVIKNKSVMFSDDITTNSYNTGSTPATGFGKRFMWIYDKAAIRIGELSSINQANPPRDFSKDWDNENIGYGSIAIGFNNRVTSESGIALGRLHSVSSFGGVAIGDNCNVTTDDFGIAIGRLCESSALSAFAIGTSTSAIAQNAFAMGYFSYAKHTGAWVIGDGKILRSPIESTADNQMSMLFLGSDTSSQPAYRLATGYYYPNGPLNPPVYYGVKLNKDAGGWSNLSDKNMKENFEEISFDEVLGKIRNLEVKKWNFKNVRDLSVKYVGPSAQDFWHAFKLGGEDSTSINTVSIDGINMLAIKALLKKYDELLNKVVQLNDKLNNITCLDSLCSRIDYLEFRLSQYEELEGKIESSNNLVQPFHNNHQEKQYSFNVYPNPTETYLNIDYNLESIKDIEFCEINICDAFGHIYKSIPIYNINSGKLKIDLKEISSKSIIVGLYINQELTITKKVIISK